MNKVHVAATELQQLQNAESEYKYIWRKNLTEVALRLCAALA